MAWVRTIRGCRSSLIMTCRGGWQVTNPSPGREARSFIVATDLHRDTRTHQNMPHHARGRGKEMRTVLESWPIPAGPDEDTLPESTDDSEVRREVASLLEHTM